MLGSLVIMNGEQYLKSAGESQKVCSGAWVSIFDESPGVVVWVGGVMVEGVVE